MQDIFLDEYISQSEAARLASVSERWLQIRRKLENGPPTIRVGSRGVRYPKRAFLAWFATGSATDKAAVST
jgi:hypothetical protein